MAAWFVDSVGWTAVTAWAALTAYNVGDLRRQLAAPAVDSERVWRCTTAGTSGAAEPAWTLTKASTTADGTAVWTEVTGNSTYNWTAPHARLKSAVGSGWSAAGDTVYVGDDHAETSSAAIAITPAGTNALPSLVLCVDHTKATPGAGDLKTTGSITTTGNSALTLGVGASGIYVYGVIFNAGTGANNVALNLGGTNTQTYHKLESCTLNVVATGATGGINLGSLSNNRSTAVDLVNCALTFAAVGHSITCEGTRLTIRGGSIALTGSVPTTLFNFAFCSPTIDLIGVDLSAFGSGKNLVLPTGVANTGTVRFINCKLGASVVILSTTPTGQQSVRADVLNSNSSGTSYRQERYGYEGTLVQDTTLIRTGGATDGVTPLSWKITIPSTGGWASPFEAFPVSQRNAVTAANIALIMYGIWNAAALPNNDDVWFDTEYMGASTSPLDSFALGTKANILAANAALTADTSAWDTLVTARANSTAYSLGDIRKVASNPGRVFFCTTAGTSAGSEPAGYASAVDGGSVTDNTAVFRAAVRFSLTVTISSPQPQLVGQLRSIVRAAKASSTFYVDPQIKLDALTYTRDFITSGSLYVLEQTVAGGQAISIFGG